MTEDERTQRRARAIELRLAGYSRAMIAKELGVRSNHILSEWLRGVPKPAWTERPNAKDDVRARAHELRASGKSYKEIERELGVARSTVSMWLRDVPLTEEHRNRMMERQRTAYQRRADSIRARRQFREAQIMKASAAEVGAVSTRDVFVAGVIAYWAEGSKAKPWNPSARVSFINSDPSMIRLFLAFMDHVGVERDRLVFRVQIHESADVEYAHEFWSRVTGVAVDTFTRPTLKRHNPKTMRRNVGTTYVGCLTIVVRRSSDLNRQIAGWYDGIVSSLGGGVTAAWGDFDSSGPGSNPGRPASNHTEESRIEERTGSEGHRSDRVEEPSVPYLLHAS